MNVLIAEDDFNIRKGLSDILEKEGYTVFEAEDGLDALKKMQEESIDFICLDIMMPGKNGYDVCREIRKNDDQIPIIFISAKTEEIDRVVGLELGGDDYILKPFGVREVVARIRAITRRTFKNKKKDNEIISFQFGDWVVYIRELKAVRGDAEVELSLREIKILQLLTEKKGQVIDRDTFFDCCWGTEYFPSSRTLDQHIAQLRKKLEDSTREPKWIVTVHGAGYRYSG